MTLIRVTLAKYPWGHFRSVSVSVIPQCHHSLLPGRHEEGRRQPHRRGDGVHHQQARQHLRLHWHQGEVQQINNKCIEYCRNFVTSCRRQQERTMMKLDTRKHSGGLYYRNQNEIICFFQGFCQRWGGMHSSGRDKVCFETSSKSIGDWGDRGNDRNSR